MSEFDREKIGEIAYESAKMLLAEQKSILESTRNRATAAIGYAGLLATFLGGAVLGHKGDGQDGLLNNLSVPEGLAIAALAVSFAAAIWILWPRKWIFLSDPLSILQQYAINNQETTFNVYFTESMFIHENHKYNQEKLSSLSLALDVLLVMIGAQIVFWLIALGA